jgi:hypothetical protein
MFENREQEAFFALDVAIKPPQEGGETSACGAVVPRANEPSKVTESVIEPTLLDGET